MSQTFVHEKVRGIYCVASGNSPITPEEWRAWMNAVRAEPPSPLRLLVRTGDTAPNAGQRAELSDLGKQRTMVVAVLTESKIARGVILALSWLGGVELKGFGIAEIEPALDYLSVPEAEQAEVKAAVARVGASFGHGVPRNA